MGDGGRITTSVEDMRRAPLLAWLTIHFLTVTCSMVGCHREQAKAAGPARTTDVTAHYAIDEARAKDLARNNCERLGYELSDTRTETTIQAHTLASLLQTRPDWKDVYGFRSDALSGHEFWVVSRGWAPAKGVFTAGGDCTSFVDISTGDVLWGYYGK